MANLSKDFAIPLRLINARSQHLKNSFKGLLKNIESRAIEHKNNDKNVKSLVTWDDWLYAAFDCYSPNWKSGLNVGDPIPNHLINNLPCPTGEIVSLGTWLLTKNIYRFENEVAKELAKNEFEGKLPSFLINISELCIYVQTDNFDLNLEESKVHGVIFTVTELCFKRVLVSTVFLESGEARSLILLLNESHTIEQCLNAFIKEFQDSRATFNQDELNDYQSLQKKIINILLWFSLTEPDYSPLLPDNHKEKNGLQSNKGNLRLYEAKKYKPYIVGSAMADKINKLNAKPLILNNISKSNMRKAHLRRAHYHLYWLGPKGSYDQYEFKWIPVTMISG